MAYTKGEFLGGRGGYVLLSTQFPAGLLQLGLLVQRLVIPGQDRVAFDGFIEVLIESEPGPELLSALPGKG